MLEVIGRTDCAEEGEGTDLLGKLVTASSNDYLARLLLGSC